MGASPPAASSDTTKMSSLSPSLPTTARLSLGPATRPSSFGTPSESASTPSSPTAMATPSGCPVCPSPLTPNTLSLCPVAGTNSSRSNLSNCKLRTNLIGHGGYINAVTVSPDGSLCASGGKDGVAMLWDLNEGKRLYSLPCEQGDIIHSLCFSP